VWRESFTVAGTLDYNLVAGISQAVQGTVTQDGVIKQSQPLVYRSVAGDNKTGLAVPGDNQFVEVYIDQMASIIFVFIVCHVGMNAEIAATP
jgi:hypothetical protein